jgi:SAM-dependent methyltransferase/uncharacterized protein YbaR (Trm112 family)
MKKRLLNYMVCPVCKKTLSLEIFQEDSEIKEGLLKCSCGETFPIIDYIPRMLVGDLRKTVYEQFSRFFIKYNLPRELKENDDKLQKKKTLKSFSYLWDRYHKDLDEWKNNFKFYFEPVGDLSFLKDKLILDAGCGNGRHTYCISDYAKEVISFDLSRSVDVAFRNNKEHDNVNFIQADIYNLPFRENLFDFIFSIGVLHYLPFPEKGFKNLLGLLKNGSGILVYVYHSFSKTSLNYYLVKLTDFLRRFTTKTPYKVLYILSYPIAIISYIIFVIPYIVLSRFFKKIANSNWPLKLYSKHNIKVLINDTFDRFSPPLEHRYSKQEIMEWYERAGLKNVKILGEGGWRIFGIHEDKSSQ